MYIILYIAYGLLFMLLGVTLVNFFLGPFLAKAPELKRTPKVSLLVPARNEAQNIANCLEGLLKQDYPDFDITVLDDHSEDETAKIVQGYQLKSNRLHLISGKALPAGWTGKNWACHQLSETATGEILIFTDADNRHAPNVVSNTVAYMEKLKLGLLSAFPQQETVTLAERLAVPIMDMFVYGSLPLWLTYFAPQPSLAAANGQWLALTREAYQNLGGHVTVKNHLVEDTELSRLAKKSGIKTLTTAGTKAVFCRMYHNFEEVREGFAKNFYGLTGYNDIVFFSIIIGLLIGFIAPYFLWIFSSVRLLAVGAIGLNILLRGLLAIRYKHPFWTAVILNPLAILLAIFIGFDSYLSAKRGIIRWKGREIKFERPGN